MRLGEWDALGQARGWLQHQLGDLGAAELATWVIFGEHGRQRILVATDVGLLDYTYGPESPSPDVPWRLRGELIRWRGIHNLRLYSEGGWDPVNDMFRVIWRVRAEEPKLEVVVDTTTSPEREVGALLAFARACLDRTP
jgi:hypothetical protein